MPETITPAPAPAPTPSPAEILAPLTKSIDDLGQKVEKMPTLDQYNALNKAVLDLKDKVETIKVGDPNVTKDDKRGFNHIGEFYKAVMDASDTRKRVEPDERLLTKAATGMSLQTGPDGGFAFPPAFSTQIMEKVMGASDSLLGLVDSVNVDGVESLTLLANAETSRTDGARWGGVVGRWKGEVTQMTDSHPKMRELKLEPQELYVMTYVTDKALRNSPVALASYVSEAAVDEINFKVGDAIYEGNGVGMPKGMLNSTCKITVARDVSSTITLPDILAMRKRLPARSRGRAVWLANQDTEDKLMQLYHVVQNVAGTENVAAVSWPNIYDPDKQTLAGIPVKFVEYAQTVGTAGDLMLTDPKGYVVGKRGSLNSAMSIHLRFDYGETAFRWIFEVDGQPYLQSAITPFHGTNTVSTIITLN